MPARSCGNRWVPMGAMSQLPRSWRVWHHTPSLTISLLNAEEHHVAATKKLGVVASYPHCACGYIPLDHSRQDGRPGSSPKLHHPAGWGNMPMALHHPVWQHSLSDLVQYGGHRIGKYQRLPNNPIWWHPYPEGVYIGAPWATQRSILRRTLSRAHSPTEDSTRPTTTLQG